MKSLIRNKIEEKLNILIEDFKRDLENKDRIEINYNEIVDMIEEKINNLNDLVNMDIYIEVLNKFIKD